MARIRRAAERAEELARIKASNEARKERLATARGETPAATVVPTPAVTAAIDTIGGTQTEMQMFGAPIPAYTEDFYSATPGIVAGRRTPSGIAGTEFIVGQDGNPVLVYSGTDTRVEPGKPAPITSTTSGVGGGGSQDGQDGEGGGANPPAIDPFNQDAFDIVKGYLRMWNLETLEGVVRGWIEGKVSEEAALMNLRTTGAYKNRFKGMQLREKANLAPIDEATYLALEDDYDAWARYYGVEGAFGSSKEQRQENFANLIGKNVNATTFKDFVETVETRVNRADPAIKQTLNRFYGITDTDLKNYYINPTENVKALQEKVTAAEIGAAGIAQGLGVSRVRAEDLARFGIDRERAISGFERIAGALPQGQLLSGIYREEGIDYTQETAEEEEFKQMESAARKRRRIAGLQEASFSGAGGLSQGSLSRGTAAGQI